jgi:hypothetical protein
MKKASIPKSKTRFIIVLVLMIVLLSTKYYYNEIISSTWLTKVFSDVGISRILLLLETLISIYITTELINFVMSKQQQQEQASFFQDVRELIEKKVIRDGTISLEDCPEVEEIIFEDIYKCKTLRKDLLIILNFSIENDLIKEKQSVSYSYINRTNDTISKTIKYSTMDREDRVKPSNFKYSYIDGKSEKIENVKLVNKEKDVYSIHETIIPIEPKSSVRIIQDFDLNLKIPSNLFYQNTVGLKDATVGIQIKVNKPKGYLFAVELLSGKKIKSTNDITADFDNINEETLDYIYEGALFPGTGIEYSLEKMEQEDKS